MKSNKSKSKSAARVKVGRPAIHRTSDGQPGRQAAVSNGVPAAVFSSRIARGWHPDDAASVPVKGSRSGAA